MDTKLVENSDDVFSFCSINKYTNRIGASYESKNPKQGPYIRFIVRFKCSLIELRAAAHSDLLSNVQVTCL